MQLAAAGALMPLLDLQTALGAMVRMQTAAGSRPSFDSLDLTVEERAWLAQLNGARGFKVTCYIQRWWRETKLQWTAQLTMWALGPEKSAEMLQNYLAAVPCPSLFFTPEAVGFLDFVARAAAGLPHVVEIARFQRALLLAGAGTSEPSGLPDEASALLPTQAIRPHPAAAIVAFAAPPELLLGAILMRQPLPAASTEAFPVLIAPGLPHLWRPATWKETHLFACSHPATTVERLLAAAPGAARPLEDLLDIGALCVTTDYKEEL